MKKRLISLILTALLLLSVFPGLASAAVPGGYASGDLMTESLTTDMQGVKFDIDRAGMVKLSKDKATLDLSKAGTNPSGLKLTYTIKKAVFKGSFAVYQLTGGRLKKFTANVTGVVVGGVGYGSAAIRGVGAVPITIQ